MSNLSVTGVIARLLLLLFAVNLPAFASDEFDEIEIYNFSAPTVPGYSGYISLGMGWDSESSKDYFVDLEVALPSQAQFLFSSSLYKTDLGFTTDETKNYRFGFFNDPDELVVFGLEYDYYKELSLYTIDTFRLSAGVTVGRWILKFIPQRRLVNGTFSILNRTANGTSTGYGGEIDYNSDENWNLRLAYHKYQYEGNALFDILLGIKPRPGDVLSARKRTILAGIEDNRWAISANYGFEWGSMGFDWARSVGVSQSADIAFVYMFSISKFVTDAFAVDLDLGSLSVSNDNEYLIFSSLSLTYFW